MQRIGLTGGLGSGKSTIAGIFQVLGIPVYYADAAAKKLMNTEKTLKSKITNAFGEAAYLKGELDTGYLAAAVFNDKNKLDLLNSIVHPATIKDAECWIQKQTSPYIIKEAALLFESGSNKYLNYVIGVSAPLELRIQRAITRDNVSREQVMQRVNKQMNDHEKLSLCDYVIINDEENLLLPQVLKLHEKFLKLSNLSVSPIQH